MHCDFCKELQIGFSIRNRASRQLHESCGAFNSRLAQQKLKF